jgi:hypothetical protein
MKTLKTGSIAVLLSLMSAISLVAHHSLGNYDTTTAVRVKGKIVQIHLINPHSIVYMEQTLADGQVKRWALEGPSVTQVKRQGLDNLLKPGDIIEVCGYVPKEAVMWQIENTEGKASLAGRLINAEMLVLPDGREQNWGDYGVHKCFSPTFQDHHSK